VGKGINAIYYINSIENILFGIADCMIRKPLMEMKIID
jgi:hypothetical protein